MDELIVILLILFSLLSYGAIGGYLASKYDKNSDVDITKLGYVLMWSYFWPIMLIRIRRKG